MPGRILTLQRQARELGRLRAGTFEKPAQGRGRPARSRGGCQRRCDGETEQLANKPCFCLAEFGEEFHLQPPEQACRPHTRLSVIMPNIPDLGVWRMESKGFYAANEIAASIDLIREATGGRVMVPIRLRIEPRKRVAQGKTKQYPVIVVEIRGSTAGQILTGAVPVAALESGTSGSQPALEASKPALTAEQVLVWVPKAQSVEQVQRLWRDAAEAKALTDEVKAALTARAEELGAPAKPVSAPPAPSPTPAPAAVKPVEGDIEPNPDRVFSDIMLAAPDDWGTSGLQERIQAFLGKPSTEANGFELQRFLDTLTPQQVS